MTAEPNGGTTLLNKSGRAAAVWTGSATAGQKIGQWVDNSCTGSRNLVPPGQAVRNTGLYLTGAAAGARLTPQTAATDGSQDRQLVR